MEPQFLQNFTEVLKLKQYKKSQAQYRFRKKYIKKMFIKPKANYHKVITLLQTGHKLLLKVTKATVIKQKHFT